MRAINVVFALLILAISAPAVANHGGTSITYGNCRFGPIGPDRGPYYAFIFLPVDGVHNYCWETSAMDAAEACNGAYQGLRGLGLTLSGNITAGVGEAPTRVGGIGSCAPYGTLFWVSEPPIVIAIDPGHGSTCEVNGMPNGTVGLTNFQSPPFGFLYENDLTVEFARETQRVLPTTKYKVVLTKNDVHSCPSYVDRGRVANNENAKAFISIHVNAPNRFGPSFPLANGTSTLYHPQRPDAQTLAIGLADKVSSSLGVNNRGAFPSDKLAVLKPTVTEMPAVILETARVSGTDEVALHAKGASTRVANGIRQALDNYFRK